MAVGGNRGNPPLARPVLRPGERALEHAVPGHGGASVLVTGRLGEAGGTGWRFAIPRVGGACPARGCRVGTVGNATRLPDWRGLVCVTMACLGAALGGGVVGAVGGGGSRPLCFALVLMRFPRQPSLCRATPGGCRGYCVMRCVAVGCRYGPLRTPRLAGRKQRRS